MAATEARAAPRAPQRTPFGMCVILSGKAISAPAAVQRAMKEAAARRWSEAAAAYLEAAQAYQAMSSATEAELLEINRLILYTNAALAWLNHGQIEAARTVLLDAAKLNPALAEQLRKGADRLPAPPHCTRERDL